MKNGTKFLAGCLLLIMLLPLLFSAEAAGSTSSAEPFGEGINVMTYNVMDDCSPNSNGVFPYDSPANREDAISQMIHAYSPDVIGMQEAGDGGVSGVLDWCSALNEDLKSVYAYRSLTDETGYKMDICRGLIIFYKKDRFTLLASGGQGYTQPANNKRCLQWVKLKDTQADVEFYVFNTHWHVDGKITLEENEIIRTSQMQELADKVNALAKDQPAFITGDFNSFYSPKNSMGDTVNITKLQEKTGFVDALLSTQEMYSVDAAGTLTALEPDDSKLMTSADHVLYPQEFYVTVKLQRILSRTYSPKLSDHDAFLVQFQYKRPTLTASADGGELNAYFAAGAYYIDNMKRGTAELPIRVELSRGEIYADEACTQSVGTDLTIRNGANNTYRKENTLYIKDGDTVYPLHLRSCNSVAITKRVLVDPSLTGKPFGSQGLYCDKWYCRPVTVGVDGFATIQEAVNAAKDGYGVMVAPGTYYEDVTYSGKSLEFYGSNRNNVTALVTKDGQLAVNTARTFETYLSGSIAFNFGDLQTGSIMVNGFHFIDRTARGQIQINGGNANKSVELWISNNLFNCYTDGAVNNGSAIHANSALKKTGSIADNYFHLTKMPTYIDSNGNTVNYTNRGITMRNMKDMAIHSNYFDGYTGSKIRPFWLSSEISDGYTVAGNGNLDLTDNRFENSQMATIYINNIRGETTADLIIAGNSYGGEKIIVDFNETAKQVSQNLPTDKTKINFCVKTEDYPNLTIRPANSDIAANEFAHYVTFFNHSGTCVYGTSVIGDAGTSYNGMTPTRSASASVHYTFKEWTDENGAVLDLSKMTSTAKAYAAFASTAHTMMLKNQSEPTCTQEGYTGDRECTDCGYVIEGSVIASKGHSVVTQKGSEPTCTQPGVTDASYCDVCKTVLEQAETIDALGHDYVAEVTTVPTFETEGSRTFTCTRDSSHTYTETLKTLSKSLCFDFDNNTPERYNNYVYNFTNFDQLDAWRGRTQGYKEGTAVMDTALGTLTVKPGTTGFTSIFADSVNCDLNFDPEHAEYYQVRFKANGFTGDACKLGMYFYYSTDNTYKAAKSVAFGGEILDAGEYYIATGVIADSIRDLDEVNRVMVYLSGFTAPGDLQGELTFDYIYAGPFADLPTPIYTVTFLDGNGNALETQTVYRGESVTYSGTTPTRASDEANHYTFSGWNCSLENVTSDLTITAEFAAQRHNIICTNEDEETHVVTCENCDYKAEEDHEFVDGSCTCGAVESTDPIPDANLVFNMDIVAGAEMVVNYNFMANIVSKYEDFYLEVSKNVAGGEPIVTTYGVTEGHTAMGSMNHPVTGAPLMFNAAYNGINAKEMGDSFATTLYAIDANGKVYKGETVVRSIKDYLLGKLEDTNSIPELKTMAVDMLKYGAAAQVNFNYDTENLVTDVLTEEQLALATQEIPEASDDASVTGAGANVNTNITVNSKVELSLSCIVAGQTGVKCIVTDKDGKVLAELATTNIGGIMYSAKYDNVGAKEMREVITATFVNGNGDAISKTVNWSVESYVAQTRARTDATETEIAMVNAMLTYGDSVAAYMEAK